jgi:hypothetical protein
MKRLIDFFVGAGILFMISYSAFEWKSPILVMAFSLIFGVRGYWEGYSKGMNNRK